MSQPFRRYRRCRFLCFYLHCGPIAVWLFPLYPFVDKEPGYQLVLMERTGKKSDCKGRPIQRFHFPFLSLFSCSIVRIPQNSISLFYYFSILSYPFPFFYLSHSFYLLFFPRSFLSRLILFLQPLPTSSFSRSSNLSKKYHDYFNSRWYCASGRPGHPLFYTNRRTPSQHFLPRFSLSLDRSILFYLYPLGCSSKPCLHFSTFARRSLSFRSIFSLLASRILDH